MYLKLFLDSAMMFPRFSTYFSESLKLPKIFSNFSKISSQLTKIAIKLITQILGFLHFPYSFCKQFLNFALTFKKFLLECCQTKYEIYSEFLKFLWNFLKNFLEIFQNFSEILFM